MIMNQIYMDICLWNNILQLDDIPILKFHSQWLSVAHFLKHRIFEFPYCLFMPLSCPWKIANTFHRTCLHLLIATMGRLCNPITILQHSCCNGWCNVHIIFWCSNMLMCWVMMHYYCLAKLATSKPGHFQFPYSQKYIHWGIVWYLSQ